jgi:hypothetical protein
MARRLKRQIEFGGRTYKVRSNKIEIPDLSSMPRIAALLWLNSHTYATGTNYRAPNPLAGLADAIGFSAAR